MYPRTEYEMNEEDFKKLMTACKSVPVIMVGGVSPRSQQENANDAWERIGKKMGFDYMTVRPIQGKDNKYFTAVPSETEFQRKKRETAAKEVERQQKIVEVKQVIADAQNELSKLEGI